MDKNEFRNQVKKERAALFTSEPDKNEADNKIFEHLVGLKLLKDAEIILSYISIRDEADTRRLIRYLLDSGKRVAVPRCYDHGKMEFYFIDDIDGLGLSSYKIPEPSDDENNRVKHFENVLCIVPGIAFDRDGKRIGYGAGYYDRFLDGRTDNITTVGLCYSSLLFDSVPSEIHDISVDYIITEKGYTRING